MNKPNYNYLWITWESQRRNISLSSALSARLLVIDSRLPRVLRYPVSIWKTLSAIRRYRPEILFVQNPSIVLAFTASLYHKLTGLPVVVDAHNAGIFPPGRPNGILGRAARYIIRNTPLTIVTNESLSRYVSSIGGRAAILPDPLPDLGNVETPSSKPRGFNIAFICSWADDEPYGQVINASRHLNDNVSVYITGRSNGRERPYEPIPDNVILTGYLADEQFTSLLHRSDLIVDLTTRDDCLVCGAYEAVSVGRPLLLSDTRALREYFNKGAVYTNNTVKDIAEKINYARRNIVRLTHDVYELKVDMVERWNSAFSAFERQLTNLRMN